jgi:hypothetical protein
LKEEAMPSLDKFIVLLILIGLLLVTFKARAELLDDKKAIEKLTPTGDSMCVLEKGERPEGFEETYMIPCRTYEDVTHYYYSLARQDGTVVVIKRVSKSDPKDSVNWWVHPDLAEALYKYERAHSF